MDKNTLYRYFNAQTSHEENLAIMNWAESSPKNKKILEDERLIWTALILHSQPSKKYNNRNRSIVFFLSGVAACVLVLLGLMTVMNKDFGVRCIHVPDGQRTELVLSDGTKVWLNSNSTLKYKRVFFSNQRCVSLDGEGYFEVAKDKHRPFVVDAGKYDIKVLGTTFNLRNYTTETFSVSLIEGKLEVTEKNNLDKAIILNSNQQLKSNESGLKLSQMNNHDDFSWKDGVLTINDLPFEEIMRRFSDYYNVSIIVNNSKILEKRYTGKFRQNDGVYFSLELLKKLVYFQYEYDAVENRIVIE